jgi:hypothetical protein
MSFPQSQSSKASVFWLSHSLECNINNSGYNRDVIEQVNLQSEKRFNQIYALLNESKSLKKKLRLCDNYNKAYTFFCDNLNINIYQEVIWDANVIYGKNGLKEFSLNDFDYISSKFVTK